MFQKNSLFKGVLPNYNFIHLRFIAINYLKLCSLFKNNLYVFGFLFLLTYADYYYYPTSIARSTIRRALPNITEQELADTLARYKTLLNIDLDVIRDHYAYITVSAGIANYGYPIGDRYYKDSIYTRYIGSLINSQDLVVNFEKFTRHMNDPEIIRLFVKIIQLSVPESIRFRDLGQMHARAPANKLNNMLTDYLTSRTQIEQRKMREEYYKGLLPLTDIKREVLQNHFEKCLLLQNTMSTKADEFFKKQKIIASADTKRQIIRLYTISVINRSYVGYLKQLQNKFTSPDMILFTAGYEPLLSRIIRKQLVYTSSALHTIIANMADNQPHFSTAIARTLSENVLYVPNIESVMETCTRMLITHIILHNTTPGILEDAERYRSWYLQNSVLQQYSSVITPILSMYKNILIARSCSMLLRFMYVSLLGSALVNHLITIRATYIRYFSNYIKYEEWVGCLFYACLLFLCQLYCLLFMLFALLNTSTSYNLVYLSPIKEASNQLLLKLGLSNIVFALLAISTAIVLFYLLHEFIVLSSFSIVFNCIAFVYLFYSTALKEVWKDCTYQNAYFAILMPTTYKNLLSTVYMRFTQNAFNGVTTDRVVSRDKYLQERNHVIHLILSTLAVVLFVSLLLLPFIIRLQFIAIEQYIAAA